MNMLLKKMVGFGGTSTILKVEGGAGEPTDKFVTWVEEQSNDVTSTDLKAMTCRIFALARVDF